jgi:hypothetical protein
MEKYKCEIIKMVTNKDIQEQNRLLTALSQDYQTQGGKAILDRCYDKYFCLVVELPYGEKYLYSRIEQMLKSFENGR